MRVALDTSALMLPVQANVRLFEELERLVGGELAASDAAERPSGEEADPRGYELVVPRAVLTELEGLANENGKDATAAAVGRDLANRCTVVETEASYVDDALVELAERGACDVVVTNDRPLRDRLSCTVIGLRGRNQLGVH